MADYLAMDKAALEAERASLLAAYEGYVARGLSLDMSRGKPSAEQLDLSMDLLYMTDYHGEGGTDARNYGAREGMPEARRFFAQMLGVQPQEVVVGGNSSLQMMYDQVALGWRKGFPGGCGPWRKASPAPKFICPVPGYDRHFRVTEEFGFEMLNVPMGPQGPDMDLVEQLVQDSAVKGIWCVPLYSNPDGYTYSDETVRRLARMQTAAPDFRIFWDNAYCVHHLTDKHDTVLNILDECRAAGHESRPLLFCSLSKVTFPGASVAAMAASEENIAHIVKNMFPMIISYDKMNQLRHVRFLKDMQGVEAHMEKHRAIVAPKFEAVWQALREGLSPYGEIARWTTPNGGYFISLYTLEGCAKRTVQLCKDAGVVLTGAGAAYPYGHDEQDSNIRIAPTYPTLPELRLACELLCVAVRLASVEKLLGA